MGFVGGLIVIEQVLHTPVVAGMYRDDIARIAHALTGVEYPSQKWQLIAHATSATPTYRPPYRSDWRTISQLWALPPGCYRDFTDVVAGLARTARGHPSRHGAHLHRRHPPQR